MQRLAVQVLAYSIRRHTALAVEVLPIDDGIVAERPGEMVPSRTGFSYSRFAVPELAGHRGRAIYLDADMLVLRDIGELWQRPFAGAKVLLTPDPPPHRGPVMGRWRQSRRIRQTSVMLLDCGALDWDVRSIVRQVGRDYSYEQLLHELCLLDPAEIRSDIPGDWNSLEHFDAHTCLIHYTDMLTQPWVSPRNRNGYLWCGEVRRMLQEGALAWAELEAEVALGHFRPSLLTELRDHAGMEPLRHETAAALAEADRRMGFEPHRKLQARLSPFRRVSRMVGQTFARGARN